MAVTTGDRPAPEIPDCAAGISAIWNGATRRGGARTICVTETADLVASVAYVRDDITRILIPSGTPGLLREHMITRALVRTDPCAPVPVSDTATELEATVRMLASAPAIPSLTVPLRYVRDWVTWSRLGRLHQELTASFPSVVIPFTGRRGGRWRLYRRVIEIAEARQLLNRYRSRTAADEALFAVGALDLHGHELVLRVEAAVTRDAVARHAAAMPCLSPGRPDWLPGASQTSLDGQARRLVLLAAELDRQERAARHRTTRRRRVCTARCAS